MINRLQQFAARELTYLLVDELRFSKDLYEQIVPNIALRVDQTSIHERLMVLEEDKLMAIAHQLGTSSSIWVRQSAQEIAIRLEKRH